MQEHGVLVAGLLDDLVRGRLGLVDEVRVEYVEFVTLHDFRWRVIGTIIVFAKVSDRGMHGIDRRESERERGKKDALVMCLIVLVPLVTRVHPVKVPRLPGPPFVFPIVRGRVGDLFFQVEQLLFVIKLAFSLGTVESFGCQVSSGGEGILVVDVTQTAGVDGRGSACSGGGGGWKRSSSNLIGSGSLGGFGDETGGSN